MAHDQTLFKINTYYRTQSWQTNTFSNKFGEEACTPICSMMIIRKQMSQIISN